MIYNTVELREWLQWFVKVRWVACAVAFVSAHALKFLLSLKYPLLPVYVIVGAVLIFNLWTQRRLNDLNEDLQRNALRQVYFDFFFLSAAVFFSGGYNSPFIYYYVFHIGISGILFSKGTAYRLALIASILILLLIATTSIGTLPHIDVTEGLTGPMSILLVNVGYGVVFSSSLFFTAYFITYMSSKLQRSLAFERRIYAVTEQLRSKILLKDVLNVLLIAVSSVHGVKKTVFFDLDKENLSLVAHNLHLGEEKAASNISIDFTTNNVFSMTFLSCVALPISVSDLEPQERACVEKLFDSAKQIALLPVWSSFRTKCYEHFLCTRIGCPAHNMDDVRCWNIEGTICDDNVCRTVAEKIPNCVKCENFLPIGVLVCDISADKDSETADLEMLTTLLDATSLAISNAKLYERTLELSEIDVLTGIKNRRSFFKALKSEFARVRRYTKNFGILMIDIDFFKRYNDTNGHPQGDVLLKMLAQVFQRCLRETDVLGRYGGEEFIILLPETSQDDVKGIAERLRRAVEDEQFPYAETQPMGKITVSIGAASYPENGRDIEEVIKSAGIALYKAKSLGKNRVEYAWALND